MPTFLLAEPRSIIGLSVSTDDVVWLGLSARDRMIGQVREAGLVLGDSDDVVTLTPGCVATADAIRRFVRASNDVSGDVVGVFPERLDEWSCHPSFSGPAQLVRLRGGGGLTSERLAAASLCDVEAKTRSFPIKLGTRPGGQIVDVVLSDAVVINVSTATGVLWANLLALAPELWRTLVGKSVFGVIRLLAGIVRARSLRPERFLGKINRRGVGVVVHPSAVVEACFLGDGVVIGPHAVVRGAIVGAGARIEAASLVVGCVLAAGAVVQRKGWAQYSVIGNDAGIGGVIQLSVVGAGAQIKYGAVLMDQNVDGDVRVPIADGFAVAPLGMFGGCVGEKTMLGCGVRVAPGRFVPPDVVILPSDGTLSDTALPVDFAGRIVIVEKGGLVAHG